MSLRARSVLKLALTLCGSVLLLPHPARAQGRCTAEDVMTYRPPQSTLSAVFYFPWHAASADCPGPATDWCKCLAARPGTPKPELGYYNSQSPAVANTHMDWLAQNGVDIVGVEWTGETYLNTAFSQAVLPAIN